MDSRFKTLNNTSMSVSGTYKGMITSTPGGAVKAPFSIIPNILAARNVYYNNRLEHLSRIILYSSIEGICAGNPPYNPVEMAQKGIASAANFNTMDADSIYTEISSLYWGLFNQSEAFAKISITDPEIRQLPQATDWAETMSEEFSKQIRKWSSFLVQLNIIIDQLVKFGISPVIWPDEENWQFRAIDVAHFFVPNQAQSDMEQLTNICVETTFTAQYLFQVYEEFKDKPENEHPWNIEELERLLLFIANTSAAQGANGNNWSYPNLMDVQRRIQNRDVAFEYLYSDTIPIVSLLYQEYNDGTGESDYAGKFSHYMFHPTYDSSEFLYAALGVYDCLQDGCLIFTASPGAKTIHSNRGAMMKVYSMLQATNQLDCNALDLGKLTATPMLQSPAGIDSISPIRYIPGMPINIGTSVFVDNKMGANINQVIGLSQYFDSKIKRNTIRSGDDPSSPDSAQGSISSTQARGRRLKEFGINKNTVAHFYTQLDELVKNIFKKMWYGKDTSPGREFYKEWKNACTKRGVPKAIFDKKEKDPLTGIPKGFSVKAARAAGDGSVDGLITGLEFLAPYVSSFSPEEADRYKKLAITVALGSEYVDTFMQDEGLADNRGGGDSLAGLENIVMQQGQMPVFSTKNDQEDHISTHLALGTTTIQQVLTQKMDPIGANSIFEVLLPHLTEHMNYTAQSPFTQDFYEQAKKAYDQIGEYARLNKKNAERMLQAQAEKAQMDAEKTQQVMSDAERKDFTAIKDAERKDFVALDKIQREGKQEAVRGEVMKEKVYADDQNQKTKIALDAKNKELETLTKADVDARLLQMQGQTPAPADIEGPEKVKPPKKSK